MVSLWYIEMYEFHQKFKKNQTHRHDKQSKCDIDEEGMKEERSRSSISGRHVCAENKNWQCYPVTLW